MAAKIEFSKNYKKISFADISEISPKRDITRHQETIENLKNRGNFPESCPLSDSSSFDECGLWCLSELRSSPQNPELEYRQAMQTGKTFSIAFIKQLSREKNAKHFVMALIKREILTSRKVLQTKFCTHNQSLLCKKMLSKVRNFLA